MSSEIIEPEEAEKQWRKNSRLRIGVRPLFAWYDLWVGVFVSRNNRAIYILPLPCIGFVIHWSHGPKPIKRAGNL